MKVEYEVVPASGRLSGRHEVRASSDDMRRSIPVCVCGSAVVAAVIATGLQRLNRGATDALLAHLERDWDERRGCEANG